ncbi:MAG: hypothetical protein J6C76_06015 [Oscillospiraceae bacterium]|nr:hypothetical protein [Oscillospiraceae bacterium]
MNRIHKRKIRRYIIAVIMLILSGYISVFIKDSIDAKNPEVSLPVISVTTGYNVITNVPRAGYEWSYTTKTVKSPFVSSIDVPLIVYEVLPDMPILIEFSTQAENITLYESKATEPEVYNEKRYGMTTPVEEGEYIYKVVAQFEQGTIVHYFALNVKQNHTIA